jgi:hypothetical protein
MGRVKTVNKGTIKSLKRKVPPNLDIGSPASQPACIHYGSLHVAILYNRWAVLRSQEKRMGYEERAIVERYPHSPPHHITTLCLYKHISIDWSCRNGVERGGGSVGYELERQRLL